MTASTEAMMRLTDAVGDRLVLFQVILVLVLILAAVLAAAMMVRPFKEFQARLHHVEQGALNTDISPRHTGRPGTFPVPWPRPSPSCRRWTSPARSLYPTCPMS